MTDAPLSERGGMMPSGNQIIEAVNTTCARGISIGTAYTEVAAMLDVPRSVVVDVYLHDSNEKIRGVLGIDRIVGQIE